MIRRLFPHPMLTLGLTVIWQLLVNRLTLGNLVLGFGLGIIIPILTEPYWPDQIGRASCRERVCYAV